MQQYLQYNMDIHKTTIMKKTSDSLKRQKYNVLKDQYDTHACVIATTVFCHWSRNPHLSWTFINLERCTFGISLHNRSAFESHTHISSRAITFDSNFRSDNKDKDEFKCQHYPSVRRTVKQFTNVNHNAVLVYQMKLGKLHYQQIAEEKTKEEKASTVTSEKCNYS